MPFTTIFTRSVTGASDGWAGYTLRQRIDVAAFTGSGNYCQITFTASANSALNITKAYIQVKGAGALDFSSAPVQITFNSGSASAVVSAGASITSDVISFPIGTQSVVIAIYTAGAAGYKWSGAVNTQVGYKLGDDAITQTPTGFNTSGSAQNIVATIAAGDIIVSSNPRISQLVGVGVASTTPPSIQLSQLAFIAVISGNVDYVSLSNVIGLNCWQPCTAFGTDRRVIYGN
jgi:hypothetical protein